MKGTGPNYAASYMYRNLVRCIRRPDTASAVEQASGVTSRVANTAVPSHGPGYVNYFAYGSNMSPQTLTGRRQVGEQRLGAGKGLGQRTPTVA